MNSAKSHYVFTCRSPVLWGQYPRSETDLPDVSLHRLSRVGAVPTMSFVVPSPSGIHVRSL
jgi:hypothetical protein